jgi:predicted dienelactone hydrolase
MKSSPLRVLARVACTLSLVFLAGAAGAASAGYERVMLPATAGDPGIEVAVWFPTDAPAAPTEFGPFTLQIARDGRLAGTGLPVVLISHGNGGSAFSHHDTAVALAEAGYVVAAVEHPGDNYKDQSRAVAMLDRPAHLSRTLDHLLTQWRGREQIDPARIGAFGFSSGGFTVLALAGGVAELERVAPHCRQHPGHYACEVIKRDRRATEAVLSAPLSARDVRDARVRAVVSAAPALGFTFTQQSLEAFAVPVQLWRAEEDELLPHPWYAEAVRAGLPKTVEYREVAKAGHFDFLAPCSPAFAARARPLCTSAEGFDRVAFHREFNAAVVAFFGRTLKR